MTTQIHSFAAYLAVFLLLCGTTNGLLCSECSYVVPASNLLVLNNTVLKYQPGSTICLSSTATYGTLKFYNFVGNSTFPIKIINCGGRATVNSGTNPYSAISCYSCKHVRITGTGWSTVTYGIRASAPRQHVSAVHLTGGSSWVTVDRLEVYNAGFAGIMAKQDPNCNNPQYWRSNFVWTGLFIHDNYIHDVAGEGLYIGYTSFDGTPATCNGVATTLYGHEIRNVRIFRNRVENTRWDGIQVGSCTQDVDIYSNRVTNYGLANYSTHANGIQIGAGTTGKLRSNTLSTNSALNTIGAAIIIAGYGNNYVFNNLIVRPAAYAISVIGAKGRAGQPVYVVHNTLVGQPKTGVLYLNGRNEGMVYKFHNNIWSGYGAAPTEQCKCGGIIYESTHNLWEPVASNVKFVNMTSGNYRLQYTSPARNAGKDLSALPVGPVVNRDFDNKVRPLGGFYDMGMYEY